MVTFKWHILIFTFVYMPFGNTHYRIKLNNWKKASESNIVSLFELKKKKNTTNGMPFSNTNCSCRTRSLNLMSRCFFFFFFFYVFEVPCDLLVLNYFPFLLRKDLLVGLPSFFLYNCCHSILRVWLVIMFFLLSFFKKISPPTVF